MVFTEFVDLIEERFGLATLDEVIEAAGLDHDGVYTAVGYYPFADLQKLLASLCTATGAQPAVLLQTFGRHMFQRLRDGHPQFFSDAQLDLFGLLTAVDGVVHVEVRKLYPEAKLPKFACRRVSEHTLLMRYESERGLADLALGLIEGAAAHFGEVVEIERVDLSDGHARGTEFSIRRLRH